MELIDRQKAIDALIGLTAYKTKREIVERCEKCVAVENGWLGGVAECLDEIEDMQEEPLPIKPKCRACPYCDNCNVNDDGTVTSKFDKGELDRVIEALENCENCFCDDFCKQEDASHSRWDCPANDRLNKEALRLLKEYRQTMTLKCNCTNE